MPEILSLDPKSVDDVIGDVLKVGEATGAKDEAERFASTLRCRVDAVKTRAELAATRPRVACLEWMEPVMVAGHWVPEMVEMAAGENCFGSKDAGSGPIEWDEMVASQPEVIIFMPCGYDSKRALQDVPLLSANEAWASLPAVQNQRVYIIDASAYTSRSGPRLVTGLEIMAEMIHPELFSGSVPEAGGIRIYGNLTKV